MFGQTLLMIVAYMLYTYYIEKISIHYLYLTRIIDIYPSVIFPLYYPTRRSPSQAEVQLQLGDVGLTASSGRITSFGWARVARVQLQDTLAFHGISWGCTLPAISNMACWKPWIIDQ